MIMEKKKSECCGCNACGDACPTGAISFSMDNEGFLYPSVDTSKCISCQKCNIVCPMNSKSYKKERFSAPPCYAAEHKSMEVLFSSTSGGAFSAFADVMYNQGGYVGGAVHNDDLSVSQYVSNNREDLRRLRRSKDLQSNSEGFYVKVKDLLDSGEKVLFCGLPCQIAALYSFLGREYDRLVTIDLICAGINSPKVWRKYLDYIEEITGSSIVATENKAKEFGWKKLTQKFYLENGDEYFDTRETSYFIKGYVGLHLFCRPSCYECQFKGFPRIGDITIGDYWGISQYSEKFNSDMGTSVILLNSAKGESLFEMAKSRLRVVQTPLEWVLPGNRALCHSISKLSKQRDDFFTDLDRLRFDEAIKKYSNEGTFHSSICHIKKNLIEVLEFATLLCRTTRLNPVSFYQTIHYSGLKNIVHKKGIIFGTNSHVTIEKNGKMEIEGLLVLGKKDKFPRSNMESLLYIGENASFKIAGRMDIDADCEIRVFQNAELIIHGGKNGASNANRGLRILCGQKIEIMNDVGIGRNVTIRDTNGTKHFINTTGYRPSRPVVIGERAWLCEACTIMPGVSIGMGAIVGVNSTVMKSVPSHSLVTGYPATVVQENVTWKM